MTKKSIFIKLLLLPIAVNTITSCSSTNSQIDNNNLSLSYKKENGKYYFILEKDGKEYNTNNTSIGVRFDKNEFRADSPIYANYDEINKIDDVFIAKGSITSKNHTTISFVDYFSLFENKLQVNRTFKVTNVGDDYGFMVEQKWNENEKASIYDYDWFVPASYYVTGAHDFSESSTRMYFDGNSIAIPADDVSVLQVNSFKNNHCFSMLDTTKGYRENIIEDRFTDSGYLYIDENINIPGIVINNEEENISYAHVYPAYTNRTKDLYIYRLLPVKENLSKEISYSISLNNYNDYQTMQANAWRDAYRQFGYVDKRYSLNEVFQTLLDYVKNSYSDKNAWGNIPQYMTKADHYFPDSGFLYRNIDLALMMLKYGRKINDQSIIDNAFKVINYQIDNDKIDSQMSAYTRDNSVFKRVLYDGLGSAVELLAYEKNVKDGNKELVEKLYSYIVKKAKLYENDDSLMALNFYSLLFKYQNILHLNYKSKVLNLLDMAIEKTKDYGGYYGAIETNNTRLSCMEDYMIILRGLVNGYELTNNKKYLNEAIRIANYLETYHVIQPLNLNLIGATGNEGYHLGFIGNERFLGYGYDFNNTNHGILDIATTSSTIEYLKLYKYTNDSHYYDFFELKLYNSLLYINMGDKIGYMDDVNHSSGKGYMNEFAGNSTIISGFADGGIKGAVHDSIIGWNVYEILSSLFYLESINYDKLNDNELIHDLSKNKLIETSTNDYTSYYMIDDNDKTYYQASNDSELVIDLNEYCYIKNIDLLVEDKENVKISVSSDKENYLAYEESINSIRYVKLSIKKHTKIFEININGRPMLYKTLSYNSTIINEEKSMNKCIDPSNYDTMWTIKNDSETLILDLNNEHDIYQIALKFKDLQNYNYLVEYSSDNENYKTYSEEKSNIIKFVYVDEKYVKARYIRLTIKNNNKSNIYLADFKVMGN